MQHKIDVSKHGPRGQAMADAIQSCVHCGFCLAACPTYLLLGEEMDSPRGRIYLIKNVLEGRLSQEEVQPYIDRCLGCVGCVPACPSGVPYGDLLMSYRAMSEKGRKRPFADKLTRTLINETLPYPNRFRLAAKSGKLGRLVGGLLPNKMSQMIELLPRQLPSAASPLPAVYPAQGKRRARVALLSGCVQTVLAPQINWATLRVLAVNGVETVIPQGQGCCGAILMHGGEDRRALTLARHNLEQFPDDVDAILTNAAGCGSGMQEYGLLFKGQPEEAAAERFANRVQDVTVFLDALGLVQPQGLTGELTATSACGLDRRSVQAVYQDACHLSHAQGVTAAPRNLLNAIPNLTLLELNDGGYCCGSAGTYNIEQPELARQLGQRKAEYILKTGATVLISGNIGCLTQLEAHLQGKVDLYHTIQLLDLAYGGD